MEGLSNSDVALLSRDNGMWGGDGAFFWIFALLILAGNGGFGFGNNPGYVTSAELQASQNAQTSSLQFQSVANSIANSQYETARLISDQSNQMLQQNNANLINAIQGFNNLLINVYKVTWNRERGDGERDGGTEGRRGGGFRSERRPPWLGSAADVAAA